MEKFEKKSVYKLYTMNLLDNVSVELLHGWLHILRVPGGWVIDKVFVPYNEEYKAFAFSSTLKMIKLHCKCGNDVNVYAKEKFQGNNYFCEKCDNEIIYDDVD